MAFGGGLMSLAASEGQMRAALEDKPIDLVKVKGLLYLHGSVGVATDEDEEQKEMKRFKTTLLLFKAALESQKGSKLDATEMKKECRRI
jgi:hypothetical protein